MALKFIPASWQTDMRTNFAHQFNFYMNPRCRTFPALTDTGNTFVSITSASKVNRGSYRMQCSGTTALTYLYQLPQRFIIEGWFKPEFAYDVAGDQIIFGVTGVAARITYTAATDKINFTTTVGAGTNSLSTTAFTSTAELQEWIYVRCYFDNTAKLKAFYCVVDGVVYADTTSVPPAGDFLPSNTLAMFTAVTMESSYWIIHELDETLATDEYKTYNAERQIMFDFNGTTLGRERIRIPRTTETADTRGVKSFSLRYSVENEGGSACANSASLSLLNVNGQFSDDQYDAWDPFQGYYNGTQKYLQNRVPFEIESMAPASYSAYDYMGYRECLFMGRTTPGAFKRSSPDKYYGEVSVDIEDGVAELGETKLPQGYSFTTHDICDPAAETDSLFHDIARIVTKKEIRNYAANASFENATITTAWSKSGGTLSKDAGTYLFGAASAKFIAAGAGEYIYQVIDFQGDDKIDVGDIFTFSGFVNQGTASTVEIRMSERNAAGAIIGSSSTTACGTDTGVWTRVSVTRTILSSLCVKLLITYYALDANTFYADGTMLTRGIDAPDYFLDNTAETKDADDASTYLYDTVAINADAVNLEHPYAVVRAGENVWDHLKMISDASIGYYLGMTPDGVLTFLNRYAEAGTSTPTNNGTVDDVSSVSTSLEMESANAIKITGVAIVTGKKDMLFSAASAAGITQNSAGKPMHTIADAAYMSVNGSTTLDARYSEDA